MFDICSNLSGIITTQFPQVKFAKIGWIDRKDLQVENNLPAVFFVDLSEKGDHVVSQYAIHRVVKNSDGTGQIIQEKLRLHTMLQISLFANNKLVRDQLGWQIKQYFVTNFRLPLLDYTQNPPVATGEYMLLKFAGDHKEIKGEANCWQRDFTFIVQSRVLDAISANGIAQIGAVVNVDQSATPQINNPNINVNNNNVDINITI